jgi:hypothetical protein
MIKNFIDKIYPKLLEKILSVFDISSGPIVGLWSLVLLIGCMYSIYQTKTVTTPVAMIFSTIISAFAGHKIVKVWKGTDSQDQSSTGDDNGNDSTKPQS